GGPAGRFTLRRARDQRPGRSSRLARIVLAACRPGRIESFSSECPTARGGRLMDRPCCRGREEWLAFDRGEASEPGLEVLGEPLGPCSPCEVAQPLSLGL